ncbi:hypothetical protein Dthio_PD3634 [Desulfonatronospira thiodismutans ASO3-1]|uniref:Uncharacterized protein n=1 Tax=Desulfonatronospira thiodismutans ASO3-1 TaxID=555779 RepID=D6SJX5_9BACT|nr:hypothetical protein [Desulfonatronospira thiodismutans]EFI36178.1 hypothetical protein Dthio_PD3634 [Desulfonatronospira thiodismutans ASO3-1]
MQISGQGRKIDTECPHCGAEHSVRVETSELSWFIKIEVLYGGMVCSPCFDDGARAYHLATVVH